jgi:hypothetical protein
MVKSSSHNSRGRPSGRHFPCDVRVRLTEALRTELVMVKKLSGRSLSEIVRQALETILSANVKNKKCFLK